MALDAINMVDIIEVMENYISKNRPPKEIRQELDINYRTDKQSIVLFEIRPQWDDKTKFLEHDFAKATFDKKSDVWKIYWLRASLKWARYDPKPTVKKLKDFLQQVDKDEYGCFKG